MIETLLLTKNDQANDGTITFPEQPHFVQKAVDEVSRNILRRSSNNNR